MMTGIECPHCRSHLALDKIGAHFQKFCPALQTASDREASTKKFNLLYTHMQSHARGEMTTDELQHEADKIFLGR